MGSVMRGYRLRSIMRVSTVNYEGENEINHDGESAAMMYRMVQLRRAVIWTVINDDGSGKYR